MIVTPEASKQPSDFETETDQSNPDEPPPSYTPLAGSLAGRSSSPPSSTFKTKPTNHLALLANDDAIRGEFVINPSLRIPPSMLPPLGEDETEDDRKNLSLRSKSGSLHTDIWLLGSPSESKVDGGKPQRTKIALYSGHGSITVQVRTLEGAAPYALTAQAPHGTVRLTLSRSFHGLLCLSTRHGSVSLSDSLIQNATQLSQLDTCRRYFIGDLDVLGEEPWQGDQVEIDAPHGSIRVKYIDELAAAQGKKGLFGRLFGK